MIERYLAPVMTFSVLIAGHLAIAMALFGASDKAPADAVARKPVLQLEAVVITAKRNS